MKVDLIDYMGSDLTVVNAARVSFNKESEWEEGQFTNIRADFEDEGIRYKEIGKFYRELKLSDKDTRLISYLAKHNHWTPFSHCMITMREKVPIFVARQRFKHMVGFTYNEVSRRYVDGAPEFFEPSVWRGKPVNAKQGSSEEEVKFLTYEEVDENWYGPGEKNTIIEIPISEEYKYLIEYCETLYNKMIKSGVAPEQARMVLPQSMYTEYYTSGSLAAWARAYKLRIDPHSQFEIQQLAIEWDKIIRPLFPVSWAALVD